jgi:hypothetical protein
VHVDRVRCRWGAVTESSRLCSWVFSVEWSAEDQEFVGLCAQHPLLSWLAATEGTALAAIMQLVRDIDEGRP